MKLSVLDQAPISRGSDPIKTLENTVALAKKAEELGYSRYWMAEHHNANGLASIAPEIIIARIASTTKRIRVGSGGVLLPQYSPLKVAETFLSLEALFPNRIDLGIGRSPGGSQLTRSALLDGLPREMGEFPRQLSDVQGFLHNTLPREHSFRLVKAGPRIDQAPRLWLLGLSERAAINAGRLGIGFVFGHFIRPDNGEGILRTYVESFQASETFDRPNKMICIFVVCSETQEKAEELALSQDKWLLQVGQGRDTKVPSVEEVKKKPFTSSELKQIEKNRKRCIIGTPEKVKTELTRLSKLYNTDEFMIITNIYDFKEKVNSYRLIAEVFSL
ncbi:LLM class flavin-dependent oxidoreductase [Gracilibacillus dipsosauri]|uniref:LLM class flavin-dependent oxidoreductase n=1 Tax=Gracilibacillus dipsosauri TaxID=178340 RepID=A0A317KY57_9BACI|nr:LLM class flavin-dependent oxidoreductase [Gracilibacillus dipsosauri]PWU68427.1 LLM class flavin-dependent oxidoreductase [Gracilibacillus dipsosauri]